MVVQRKLSSLRRRTKVKSLPSMTLTAEELLVQFKSQSGKCYYTGVPLRLTREVMTRETARSLKGFLSVDRRDSTLGYTASNIVLASYEANTAKRRYTEEEYIAKLKEENESNHSHRRCSRVPK